MIALKIIFGIPVIAVGIVAALHATAYLHGEAKHHLPKFWGFFIATILAMLAVVAVDSKIAFLLAWEAMGLASAGLVAFEASEKSVRRASWIYLLACHAGAVALMLSGVLLGSSSAWLAAFILALIGFGLKIGFPPFHAWLPEAHPAAPAPASAIMSGAMIPLGYYGLLKFFSPLNEATVGYASSVGWTFLIIGAVGGLGGILFALPQTNLKKLLAFSSVENMGIVALGLGLGSVAISVEGIGSSLAKFAIIGGIAHVLNHAFLKGALFLLAGSVLRQTGTLDQDRLGGLLKRMPFTGTLFTINAMGLAGLPPLNAFIGELILYVAAFNAVASSVPSLVGAGFLVLIALSTMGGLAAAAYTKAIGATFLGEPRSTSAIEARETPCRMWLAALLLTLLSIVMVPGTIILADRFTGGFATSTLVAAAIVSAAFVAIVLALLFIRRFLCPRGKEKPSVPVWDCGYDAPTARMAYTGSAFTQPLADLFQFILRSRRYIKHFKGDPAAPSSGLIATETNDIAIGGFWRPIFSTIARLFQRIHLLQSGSLHLYILIILLAVLALLVAALVS